MLCVQLPSSLLIGGIIVRPADSTPGIPVEPVEKLRVVAAALVGEALDPGVCRNDDDLFTVEAGIFGEDGVRLRTKSAAPTSSTIVTVT